MKTYLATLIFGVFFISLNAQTKSTDYYSFTVPKGFIEKYSSRQSTEFTFAKGQSRVFVLQKFNQTPQERELQINAHDFDRPSVESMYSQADPATLIYHFEKKRIGAVPIYLAYYSNSNYPSICELTAYYKGKVFLFVMREKGRRMDDRKALELNFNQFLKTLSFH